MSQGDTITLQVRVLGARAGAGDLNIVAASSDRVAASTARTGTALKETTAHGWLFNQMMFTLRRVVYAGTLGLTAAAAAATLMGLSFNASMEMNQVAFQHFIGSADGAKKELLFLYNLAAHTPFEFPQLTDAARKFLAFGFSVDETNKDLTTIGDTIAGLGLGSEAIDRLVLAIGQIRAKGRVMGEELLQITELGIPAYQILQEQLGLTGKQIGRIGELGIPANIAIEALMRGMQTRFKNAAEEQSKTFTGQASTLRDNVRQLMGAGTEPLFLWLRNKVLPALNDTAVAANEAFKHGGWTAAIMAIDDHLKLGGRLTTVWERLTKAAKDLKTVLIDGVVPGARDAWTQLQNVYVFGDLAAGVLAILAHNTGLVSSAVEIMIYYLIISRALMVANAFWTGVLVRKKQLLALWEAINTKLLKAYIFWTAASTAATKFYTTWLTREKLIYALVALETYGAAAAQAVYSAATLLAAEATTALTLAMLANPIGLIIVGIILLAAVLVTLYFKWQAFHDLVDRTFHFFMAHKEVLLAPFIALPLALYEVATHLSTVWNWIKKIWDFVSGRVFTLHFSISLPGGHGLGIGWRDIARGIPVLGPLAGIPGLAGGGTTTSYGSAWVGEHGPELLNLPRGASVTPMQSVNAPLSMEQISNRTLVVESPVYIGRREIARAVNTFNDNTAARK